MGSGIGKSCGKSAGLLGARAALLKESLKGTGRPVSAAACSTSRGAFQNGIGEQQEKRGMWGAKAEDLEKVEGDEKIEEESNPPHAHT